MLCLKISKVKNNGGFTLIEVIISLVVAGIFAAMLASFMGTSMMRSANPVINAQYGNYLNSIMENMYSDYKYQMYNAVLNGQTPQTAYSVFDSHVNTANYYSDASHPYTVTKKTISFTGNPPQEIEDANSKIHKITITIQYENYTQSSPFNNLSVTQIFTE